jgi:hypothetical protein
MKAGLNAVRFEVARKLQEKYKKLISSRGHSPAVREELDHALSLVLNGGRYANVKEHLLRNVCRDARRVLRRGSQSRGAEEQFEALEEGIPEHRIPDPEQLLMAKQRLQQMAGIAATIASDASVCLPGLLEGESVEECIARTNLPARRIRYMRACLRAHVRASLTAEKAA